MCINVIFNLIYNRIEIIDLKTSFYINFCIKLIFVPLSGKYVLQNMH